MSASLTKATPYSLSLTTTTVIGSFYAGTKTRVSALLFASGAHSNVTEQLAWLRTSRLAGVPGAIQLMIAGTEKRTRPTQNEVQQGVPGDVAASRRRA